MDCVSEPFGRAYGPDDMVVITSVDNRAILDDCLRRSPDVAEGQLPVIVVEGATSMHAAFNEGLSRTDRRLCLFAHQDVYLPRGWQERALAKINELEALDPDWQVAGVNGVLPDGSIIGRVWDVFLGFETGARNDAPVAVGSFDELLLILRREPGYRFDDKLPHFHMYGTDIAQTAIAAGRGVYVLDLPLVHNNRPITSLKGGYADAYHYMRRKWRSRLPIQTTCSTLSRNPYYLWRSQRGVRFNPQRTEAVLADAAVVARQIGYE